MNEMNAFQKLFLIVSCLSVALWDVVYCAAKVLFYHSPTDIDPARVTTALIFMLILTGPIISYWDTTWKRRGRSQLIFAFGCVLILLATFPFTTSLILKLGHRAVHAPPGLLIVLIGTVLGKILVLALMVHGIRSTEPHVNPNPVDTS